MSNGKCNQVWGWDGVGWAGLTGDWWVGVDFCVGEGADGVRAGCENMHLLCKFTLTVSRLRFRFGVQSLGDSV